jgi:hypothetical protein
MRNFRESLWLPAAVLAIGVALMLAVLAAADRASPASVDVSAYPVPFACLYLPVIRQNIGAARAAQATDDSFQIAPAATAYPPPTDPCSLQLGPRIYLPIIRR